MQKDVGPHTERPQIMSYQDPIGFLQAMIDFRRQTEAGFSVANETKKLRKVSPTLVSLILKGKRRLTADRADEFARLLGLSVAEKNYLRDWLLRLEGRTPLTPVAPAESATTAQAQNVSRSKQVSTHILSDWLNLYVKDAFQIPEVRQNPELIYSYLGHIAPRSRIDRSLTFLLREGHLRRTPEGRFVVEVPLTVTDPQIPSRKIREFHRATLKIAREAIEAFPPTERFANAMTLPLTPEAYAELIEISKEFAGRLQEFAARQSPETESARLYQIVLNLSPTGGKSK